ncbi:MAG: SDR family oxidoreductase [Oscillospiraceae bacterium]|nr:SDR family oxidoreductase [Oscillospiraceae bacterium]
MGRLDGKVAIITGGGSGMGAACTELFVKEGAKVVTTGRRIEKMQSVVAEFDPEGKYADSILVMRQDVSKEEDWLEVAAETEKRFGKIDILVNNAGVLDSVPLQNITYENWKSVMDINGWGQLLGYKTIVPYMQKIGGGNIVVVSSMAAVNSGGGLTAYCASKGASDALSRAASVHLAPLGIRTNCILPGTIETPMLRDAFPDEESWNAMCETQLLKRVGTPMEIAYLALYLASDESGFTNGVSVIVDGGVHNSPATVVADK